MRLFGIGMAAALKFSCRESLQIAKRGSVFEMERDLGLECLTDLKSNISLVWRLKITPFFTILHSAIPKFFCIRKQGIFFILPTSPVRSSRLSSEWMFGVM